MAALARPAVRRILTLALLGTWLVAAPALADSPTDARIFRDTATVVTQYVHFTVFDDIRAAVDDGVVTLTGSVTMPYKAADIERLVANVSGVRRVQNRIEVLPVSRFDDELRFRIARAIYGNPAFARFATHPNPPIHIVVNRGHVTLTGAVPSDVDRMLARSLAGSSQAFSVTNELRTDAELGEARARRVR